MFEVDPRHAEISIDQLKLKEAKVVFTLGTKDEGAATIDCADPFCDK